MTYNFVFGIELEFYIYKIEAELFLSNVKKDLIPFRFFCEQENSVDQYEVKSSCYTNIDNLVEDVFLVRNLLIRMVRKLGGDISFKAKPHLDRAGSALNVHVNLVDSNNNNLFYNSKQKYSNYLFYSVGGLCTMMKRHMLYFAPNENSYLRFQYPDIHTPTTVSWGMNNRTAAIRIPNFAGDSQKCRLEHRVPGADCDLEKVLIAIMEGIDFGIKNKIAPPNMVYGITSDLQYSMEILPLNKREETLL